MRNARAEAETVAGFEAEGVAVEGQFDDAGEDIADLLALVRDGLPALSAHFQVVDVALEEMAVLVGNDAFEHQAARGALVPVEGDERTRALAENDGFVVGRLVEEPADVGFEHLHDAMDHREGGQDLAVFHLRQETLRAFAAFGEFLQRQALHLPCEPQPDAEARRYDRPAPIPPSVIGIDDWAWRRNHRYGTIICDLERRRAIALLPDREQATAEAWLIQQPQIEIVARDRGGGYAKAVARALPHADQVADRWHLMENASQAFLDAVRKSMRQVRMAIGTATVNPKLLTAAERLQYEGYLRREETNAVIRGFVSEGLSIKEIVRRTGHSRKLVRSVVRGQRTDIFRVRQTSLEPHLPWLEAQWDAGLRNGAELWRQLRLAGFGGGLRVVTEWATRRRRAEKG
ncbi:transposase [Shinella sp. WSC3-e]|nr:transposase [Shinella sp. WSC3-e]